MVEVINGVENLKKLNIGKGLTSSPIFIKIFINCITS